MQSVVFDMLVRVREETQKLWYSSQMMEGSNYIWQLTLAAMPSSCSALHPASSLVASSAIDEQQQKTAQQGGV